MTADAMSGALRPHVESGEVAGLVALVGRGDDIEVTVLGEQAVGGAPMRHAGVSGAWKVPCHSSRLARVIGSLSQGGAVLRTSMRRQISSGGVSR